MYPHVQNSQAFTLGGGVALSLKLTKFADFHKGGPLIFVLSLVLEMKMFADENGIL